MIQVSVEPLPKQGCEISKLVKSSDQPRVSVEPLPKQGCEKDEAKRITKLIRSQWNPCRSRGARSSGWHGIQLAHGLSGTPAEAGVRDEYIAIPSIVGGVSVEPLPKQGCEKFMMQNAGLMAGLSGTPAEAGVRDA